MEKSLFENLKPETIKLLKELLEDEKPKSKKSGPDPKLKYDIDWFEGPENPHAEYNKSVRLKAEEMASKKKALDKQKVNLCDLIHEQWEVLTSDYHHVKEMKRLNEVAEMFSVFGYNRIFKCGGISSLIVVKDGSKMVEGIIITAGEEDGDHTIYPGIQLTKTVVKSIKKNTTYVSFEDCTQGISYYNGDEDSYFSGKTKRWGFDYEGITLSEFIKKFKP